MPMGQLSNGDSNEVDVSILQWEKPIQSLKVLTWKMWNYSNKHKKSCRFVTTYKTTSVNVKKSLHIQVIDRNDTLYDLYFEAHILDRCTNLSWGQKVHTTKP